MFDFFSIVWNFDIELSRLRRDLTPYFPPKHAKCTKIQFPNMIEFRIWLLPTAAFNLTAGSLPCQNPHF